jgi:hypothetical protein
MLNVNLKISVSARGGGGSVAERSSARECFQGTHGNHFCDFTEPKPTFLSCFIKKQKNLKKNKMLHRPSRSIHNLGIKTRIFHNVAITKRGGDEPASLFVYIRIRQNYAT